MKYLSYYMLLIVFILNAQFIELHAQSAEKIKNQLKNAGLSIEQAKKIARDKGYSDSQIESEAELRGIDIKKDTKSSQNQIDNISDIEDQLDITTDIDKKNEGIIPDKDIIKDNPSDYFGYNIFKGDPAAFQASTFGAVDPNYNIGPGDEIIVMLWGESQFRQKFIIDREGYVFIPEIGQVFVNGLTLENLEKKFFQILSKVYSTLNPSSGKPTTFIDISLGDLRPLRIIILGEVEQPGSYSVSPSTSLSSSLYYFRGPTTNGSLRDIRLIRGGKPIANIDFYDYLLSGNTPNDVRLQLDDIVFIPPRGKTVSVYGEVKREGIYELKESENLYDLLNIAGSLKVTAYMNRAQITRIIPPIDREKIDMERMIVDIDLRDNLNKNNTFKLVDGDILKIFSISNMERNYVLLTGSSVIRPGKFQYSPNMTVKDLIDLGEGLTNDAFLNIAHIIRVKDDLTNEIINININEELNNNKFFLKRMDKLVIYNENILKNSYSKINISGPVKRPGSYSFESNKTLGDLILLSGGFNDNVKKVKLTVARINPHSFSPKLYVFPDKDNEFFIIDLLDDPDHYINNFKLKSNDIINIYSDPKDNKPDIVHIYGAVYFPGDYPILSKNEKVSDIIVRAGGLLPEAYPMASSFIRNKMSIQLSFQNLIDDPNSKDNFNIFAGDSIILSTYSNIVEIYGEVNNPGVFKLYKNYNVRDYIRLAGGLTVNAEKKEIWVTYPDGRSKQLRTLRLAPNIYDSSIISVGKKADEEPFDATAYASELTSIVANVVQLLLLYNAVNN